MSPSPTTSPESDPLAGTKYRSRGVLGRGSASEVYEALSATGELRAVKLLRDVHAPGGDLARRFAQEARALAALRHPNVVHVVETGLTPQGRPFLVMPRLVGETLRDRLRRGALAPAAACELVAGALDGLDHAHGFGIVHRDVKPANLFLAPRPGALGRTGALRRERVIVIDFGIAKVAGGSVDPTTGAHVLGTPRYLAPEQVLGGEVDARTDVYAAGIVLFEAIAGRGPYDATAPIELMHAHVRELPRRLSSIAPAARALDAIVARAMAKRPAQRWPSARAFAIELRRAGAAIRDRDASARAGGARDGGGAAFDSAGAP